MHAKIIKNNYTDKHMVYILRTSLFQYTMIFPFCTLKFFLIIKSVYKYRITIQLITVIVLVFNRVLLKMIYDAEWELAKLPNSFFQFIQHASILSYNTLSI